jgi:O-antigen ligase
MTLLTHAILLAAPGAGGPSVAMRLYHGSSMAGTGLILFLTRSRTAFMACLAGLAALACARWLGKLSWKRTLWSAGTLALALILWGGRLFSSLADYYSLFGKYRNISNATNRTEIWSYVWDEIIANHPFLGVGPGLHGDLVERGIGFSSAHNGVLMYLAEIGVLGTLPYLIVFFTGLRRALKDPALRTLVLPLLVAGGVESMAETMFFSTGNVGSLLFLFALVVSTMGFGAAHPL